MKVIPLAQAEARLAEIVRVLTDGGLACFPVGGAYRLAVDARSEAAVERLMHSKRRAKHHPALVLVSDLASAKHVVDGTQWPTTRKLAEKLWPGPLTLVLPPSDRMPTKVKKTLTRATGTLGVRVSDDPLASRVVKAFGGPLLLSSANLEQKPGASSAATVQQRFVRAVDVWVDAGDMKPAPPSTVVAVRDGGWDLVRDGAISREAIERACT